MDLERLYGGKANDIIEKVRELADDIDSAVLPASRSMVLVDTRTGDPTGTATDIGIVLRFCDGKMLGIRTREAEMILNDGILNRVGITIKFADGAITNKTDGPDAAPASP